jgi:hypothetical protein
MSDFSFRKFFGLDKKKEEPRRFQQPQYPPPQYTREQFFVMNPNPRSYPTYTGPRPSDAGEQRIAGYK